MMQRLLPLSEKGMRPSNIEARFFASLQNICQLYKLPVPTGCNAPFPYNIRNNFSQLEALWEERGLKPALFIADEHGRTGTIATIMSHQRDYDLYYIPVQRVCKMMQSKKDRYLYALLISTFAYLYQIVGMPHYLQGSVVGMAMEWMQDNIDNGEMEDPQEQQLLQGALDEANLRGEELQRAMAHPAALTRWPKSLERLRPASDWELEVKLCSAEFYGLYKQYPHRNIGKSCFPGLTVEKISDEDNFVILEDFMSFIFFDEGCQLEDTLMGYIESFLQEKTMDYTPAAIQFFDRPQQSETFDFQFQTLLFKLLNQLCGLLNHHP